jgi:hypothetical protein
MLLPSVRCIPGGVSAHISVKPPSLSNWLCMILSDSAPSMPYSPNVLMVRVPPKTSL